MLKNAHLSSCRTYRYALWRTWDDTLSTVQFIGLNPSTADETVDDPTLVRCVRFAQSWGYGSVCMTNLFAYRATNPRELKTVADPIGLENDVWLKRIAESASLIVAAWGNHGQLMERSTTVRSFFRILHCLDINRSGEPAHPLYQPSSKRPKQLQIG